MREIIETIQHAGLKEVFFGAQGFSIADEQSIKDLQLGYSIHPDGSDLTGSCEGDWQESWVVVGNDTELGDPFFVNVDESSLPIYTAMHGIGDWAPELVSTSLNSFLKALCYLKSLSLQDFARIDPDEGTITDSGVLLVIEKKLCDITGEKEYWQTFIERHKVWIDESEC